MNGERWLAGIDAEYGSFWFHLRNEKHPNDHTQSSQVATMPMAGLCYCEKKVRCATRVGQPQADVGKSEEKFSTQNFHSASTDAHIDYSVTLVVGANENSAWTFHLDALFDQNLFA